MKKYVSRLNVFQHCGVFPKIFFIKSLTNEILLSQPGFGESCLSTRVTVTEYPSFLRYQLKNNYNKVQRKIYGIQNLEKVIIKEIQVVI